MKSLVVRKEIDAFIADRLLEAVWQESLHLVNDGVASTKEIDDAIRYGFVCAGRKWDCSKPTMLPAVKRVCAFCEPIWPLP